MLEDRIIYSAIVALCVWVLTRVYEFIMDHKRQSREQERFVRALYSEIDLNTSDMEEFIGKSASLSAVSKKIFDDNNFIPHITDERHRDIYKSKIDLIHHAGDNYIGQVVEFYGILEKITREIDGIYLPSYKTISSAGRVACIDDIWRWALHASMLGRTTLADMEASYPYYQLKRKNRTPPEILSSGALKAKADKLASDLDRARTSHFKPPTQ